MNTKIGIIGYGSVGSEICLQAQSRWWDISWIIRSQEICDTDHTVLDVSTNWKSLSAVDLVFLSIPSDQAAKAQEYIAYFCQKGIPVVTCEKWALSEYPDLLAPYMDLIGKSATVWGGTRMLSLCDLRSKSHIQAAYGVLNGTLNYIFDELSQWRSKIDVLADVLDKKYAEPGSNTLSEVIEWEISDLTRKAIILTNALGILDTRICWSKDISLIDPFFIEKALQNPSEYRFVYTISDIECAGFIWWMKIQSGKWWCYAGLFLIKNTDIETLSWVTNFLTIVEDNQKYTLSGPGAGPIPTARAMLLDACELLHRYWKD